MHEIYLRAATPADESFLWAMLFEASRSAEQGRTSPEELHELPELAHYVEKWGAPGDLGMIGGPSETDPLGAAWLRLFTPDNHAYGYINDRTPELAIAVAPQARGTGLGTALMTHLLDVASEHYDAVSLSVRESNPARRLYARLGFRDVPGGEIINRAGTTSYTMLLRFR